MGVDRSKLGMLDLQNYTELRNVRLYRHTQFRMKVVYAHEGKTTAFEKCPV